MESLMAESREVHSLAAFVHGILVAFHTLGAVYNARKHNGWQTWAHGVGIVFSVHSTIHHCREAGRLTVSSHLHTNGVHNGKA